MADAEQALAAAAARLAATHRKIAHGLHGDDPRVAGGGTGASPSLVGVLADDLLAPLAQQHPWALVGGAALAGALVAARPWRCAVQPALMAGLLSPAASGWALRWALPTLLSAWGRRARPGR